MNTSKFSMIIEQLVKDSGISYMEAVVHYCERNEVEVESAGKLLNTKIKQQIAAEASDLSMLKEKYRKLPC